MSFFDIGLYASLSVCLGGIIWRAAGWLRAKPGSITSQKVQKTTNHRGGLTSAFIDVLLLRRTLARSFYRWLAHTLILSGFTYLLLFHAMATLISVHLADEYWPTRDPWQLLRNLAGLLVLLGLTMALLRRLRNTRLKRLSRKQDWLLLALVGSIMVSGFMLEAQKIISTEVFDRMVVEYLGSDDPKEIKALKAYWALDFGGSFNEKLPMDAQSLNMGEELAADSCISCHAKLESAFVSLGLSKLLTPLAKPLDRISADQVLYYLHIVLCFAGLAALPWGKLLHPVSTPLNLLIRRGETESASGAAAPGNLLRGLAMAACTGCGECSLYCSVAPAYSVLGNEHILPSEKLLRLTKFQNGRLQGMELERFAQGSRICTECLRCTQICPSGIDLQELWMGSKPDLTAPQQEIRTKTAAQWARVCRGSNAEPDFSLGLAGQTQSFQACMQCTTCTNVCPVVAGSPDPVQELDATPQQIMNLLRMGMIDQAMGAGMAWSCTTCYQCQENCPQNIPVADLLFELRNIAIIRMADFRRRGAA